MDEGQPAVGRKLPKVAAAGLTLGGVAAFGALGESGLDGGLVKEAWQLVKQASPMAAAIMFLMMLDAMAKRERADLRADASQQREREMALQYVTSMNKAGSQIDELAKAQGAVSTLVVDHLLKNKRRRRVLR